MPTPGARAGYRVRPMTAVDADAAGRVHVTVWREAYAGLMRADYLAGLDLHRSAERWRLPTPAGSRRLVGTTPDGAVVAIAAAGPPRDTAAPAPWELWMLNILAAHHGTGLADLLMAELVGERAAYLWVLDGNARAQAFYRRHGFAVDGATKPHAPTGTTEVRMVRAGGQTR